ncbi:hypothetical protein YIM730264_06050 [Thermus hydrothermalis]
MPGLIWRQTLLARRPNVARSKPHPSKASGTRTSDAAANGPPEGGGGEDGGEGGDQEDDPPPPLRAAPKRRGRPGKTRRFRAFPSHRTHKKRRAILDAIAEALAGRPAALFLTLTPTTPTPDEARRLAAVHPSIAKCFSAFAARLRREGALFAVVVETRSDAGAFFPHAHGIVAGVPLARLKVLAARSGLTLHAEALRDPRAAARYLAKAAQRRHYDAIQGARGFWASTGRVVYPGTQKARSLPAEPVRLAPGVVVVDIPRFLRANLAGLRSPSPVVRKASATALRAFCQATGLPPDPQTLAAFAEGGGP